jgi:glycosyltransferase involved in cell wall biosynthesis
MCETSPSVTPVDEVTGAVGSASREAVDLCVAALHFHPAYAGPAIRFRRYAPGLRRRNVAMRVFTVDSTGGGNPPVTATGEPQDGDPNGNGAGARPWRDRVDEISVLRQPLRHEAGTRRGWWEYQRRLVELCERSGSRPEVLQLLSVDPWSAYFLFRIRRLGVPTIYTHTMQSSLSDRWWKRPLQRIYWPLPYRFLDCTVVSSGVMRDNLREIGVRGRIEVIPNGTDMERFRPVSRDEKLRVRRDLGLDGEEPVVLFVGSISPRKGVDVLLEAWVRVSRSMPEARLVLVGPRHDEIRPDETVGDFFRTIEESLAAVEAPDRVVFTGAVDEVDAYYRAADLFVFPSRKEGMPNVVPEAYACGLPVVMTPFQGLPEEFGRPGEHHRLVERTPEAIARAVVDLLESEARRREMGARARAWAEERLGLATALDRYAELYRELSGRDSDRDRPT